MGNPTTESRLKALESAVKSNDKPLTIMGKTLNNIDERLALQHMITKILYSVVRYVIYPKGNALEEATEEEVKELIEYELEQIIELLERMDYLEEPIK